MVRPGRARPSTTDVDNDLQALRGLPAAGAPLSWVSEDSVLLHSAINALENYKLKDLRLRPFRRVKPAQSSISKVIKRITASDEGTKSVSFADATPHYTTMSKLIQREAQHNEMRVAKDDTADTSKVAATMQDVPSFLAVGQDTSDDDHMAAAAALSSMEITAQELNDSDRGMRMDRIAPFQHGPALFCRTPSVESKERAWYNLDVGRAICLEQAFVLR